MKKILCVLFGHIWKKQGNQYVCERCGAIQPNK